MINGSLRKGYLLLFIVSALLIAGSAGIPVKGTHGGSEALGVNGTFTQPVRITGISAGATFTVSLNVTGFFEPFNSYQIRVGFDNAVLDAVGVDFTGSMFAKSGLTVFTLFPAAGTVEESPGIVRVSQAVLGGDVSGAGGLFAIRFQVLSTTTAPSSSPVDVGCEGDAIAGVSAPSVCSAATAQDDIASSVTFNPIPHDTYDAIIGHVDRFTSTSVACDPVSVVVNQATSCTGTVTDLSGGLAPNGLVSFSTSGFGIFSSTSCVLAASGASSGCSVNYMPTAVGSGTHSITARYEGGGGLVGSSGSTDAEVVRRSTSTTVICSPSFVVIGQANSCTATVSDTSLGTAVTPTGTVSLTSSGAGSFSGPCNLTGAGSSASCTVSYVPGPSSVLPRTDTITANYPGDASHNSSSGSTVLGHIDRFTRTTVSCIPSSIVLNQATSCTATVTDVSTSPITSVGTVSFTSTGTGTFIAPSCTLSGTGASASCSVTYTPNAIGTGNHTITATYPGDANHRGSTGSTSVSVAKRETSTAVICTPSAVDVGDTMSCTATIRDESPGTPIPPTGTVRFNVTGPITPAGSFTPPDGCILTGTGGSLTCSITYTPSVDGIHTITANHTGDATHNGSSGSINVTAQGVVDVAVAGVAVSPTIARTNHLVGDPMTIEVKVQNEGTLPLSSIGVTAKADSSPVCVVTISSLAAGEMIAVSCTWNTASDTPGTYSIMVCISTLSGERDIADNCFTYGTVTLVLAEPLFVRGKLSWTHHLSLFKNADTQTWTAKVRNDAVGALYVQVIIDGASTDGLRTFSTESTALLMVPGEQNIAIDFSETFAGMAGTKFCFEGHVIYSNSAAMVNDRLANAVRSITVKSGCFAIVP